VGVYQHVKSGAIATADLEPIDCRKCLVDRQECFERPCRSEATRQFSDDLCSPKPVAGDRPHTIANRDERVVPPFEFGGRETAEPLEAFFFGDNCSKDLVAVMDEPRPETVIGEHEPKARNTPQEPVSLGEAAADIGQRIV
jgi:hypothetical protein